MKTLSFWRGVLLAALISVVCAVVHLVLSKAMGGSSSLRLCVLGAALIYVWALLALTPKRSGRLLAAVFWLVLAMALIAFNPPLLVWLLLQTGFIWLLRALQSYDSLIPAISDALLSGFALAAAIATALHTHSLFLALWSFFLVQALVAFIPVRANSAAAPGESDFETSYRNAQIALRRLSLRS